MDAGNREALHLLIGVALFIVLYAVISLFDKRPDSPFRLWLKSKRPVLLGVMITWLCIRYSLPNDYSESVGLRSVTAGIDLTVLVAAFTVLAQSIYYKIAVGWSMDNIVRGSGAAILTCGAALSLTDDVTHIYPSFWCILTVLEAAVLLSYAHKFYRQS